MDMDMDMEAWITRPEGVRFHYLPFFCLLASRHCHSLVLAYLLNKEATDPAKGRYQVFFLAANIFVVSVSGLDGAYAGLKRAQPRHLWGP